MRSQFKKYIVLLQSDNGVFRKISLYANSSEDARTTAESGKIKYPDEKICSVIPSSFLLSLND